MAARCWDYGFECRRGHGCLFLRVLCVVQIEVLAAGRSPVQRIPTDSCVCVCVCVSPSAIKGEQQAPRRQRSRIRNKEINIWDSLKKVGQ